MLQTKIAIISCLASLVGISTTSVFGSESQEDEQPIVVTWKTFTSRDNLATAQYPSNWTPAGIPQSGPIDMYFTAPSSDEDSWAEVELIQYEQKSPFSTPKESLEAAINSLQNDPKVTKFEIERPVECSKYTLNGLPACSYIYEVSTQEEGSEAAIMDVNALAHDGTEYDALYRSSFDSFEHFLPVAEYMIKSFQVTGDSSSVTDFAFGDGSITSLNTTTSRSTNTTGPLGTSSSNDDDFSFG